MLDDQGFVVQFLVGARDFSLLFLEPIKPRVQCVMGEGVKVARA
jgi:hypothetical protein